MKPGFYPGVPMAQYLATPAVNADLICTIVNECPRAAWHRSWLNPHFARQANTAAQSAGTAAHAIVLEGSEECIAVIDPASYPGKNGNVPDGWTNPAIRAARDAAIAAGKVPMLPDAMGAVRAMASAAREFIDSLRETEPAIWAAFQPGGGDSEGVMVWEDRGGILCRARPDRISTDRRLIVDYKTGGTTAEPDTWGRTQLVNMGYYTSSAFYRRGAERLFGVEPDYVFLVQEQEQPHLCSLVGVDPQARDLGGRKVRRGLEMWDACVRSNRWPAYPNRVCYPELPVWEEARWETGHGNEQAAGIAYDPATLYAGVFERKAA